MHIANEAIVAALIEYGSVRAAADSLNCSRRTLYTRMKTSAFQELYSQAKTELVKAAAAKLSNSITGAVDVLTSVMNDTEAPAQTRVNAAANVFQYAVKLTTTNDILVRLQSIEEVIK